MDGVTSKRTGVDPPGRRLSAKHPCVTSHSFASSSVSFFQMSCAWSSAYSHASVNPSPISPTVSLKQSIDSNMFPQSDPPPPPPPPPPVPDGCVSCHRRSCAAILPKEPPEPDGNEIGGTVVAL